MDTFKNSLLLDQLSKSQSRTKTFIKSICYKYGSIYSSNE